MRKNAHPSEQPHTTKFSVRKIAVLALYTVLSLTIFLLESLIPQLVPIPGIKLGLANIVTLLLLLNYKPYDAAMVLLARILLSAFFAGQAMSLLYSLSGGLLSLLVMALINLFLHKKHIYLTGIFGALAHNAGQLLVAYLVTSSAGILSYAPFLMLSAIVTGLFTGLCAFYSQKYLLPHIPKFGK